MTDPKADALSLPTGTVTFLLTDVEGSSRAWEEAGDVTALAIRRHYNVLDDVIAAHRGVRPVEQGEGDSTVSAFSRASDAVAAALAGQRLFRAEAPGLRVRMAVHTGEAQLRDDHNYFGQAIIRGARIRDTAHGDQVVLSDATAALIADRLPDDARLVDLGVHRLKDLGRPERLWQLAHPDLPHEFPALRSLDAYRHNLPLQLTPLIGRVGSIAEVRTLLGADRLVTLTGAGGVGKTRLGMAVAAEATETHRGGVWWVDLAPVTEPGAVARAALGAIGAEEVGGSPAVHQLAVELGKDPSLLLLDNCEHVIVDCAGVVARLLAVNGAVTVLATSREPLRVPGEVTWRVPSLELPPPEEPIDVPTLSQYDAVRLFVDRARRARPSFTVNDINAPAVAQICHRVDGIPLAIELAAARCRHLSAERIATELDDRFRLLTGGARTVVPRHQSLAASIAWTHDRLDDAEKRAFRRLGVFAGPFTLEAAEAVVAAPGDVESVEVFDLLSRLVDRSLVVASERADGAPRYRLLETLRAYAIGEAAAADELEALRRAHAKGWLRWLASRFQTLHTDAVTEEVDELHADLLSALNWAAIAQPRLGLQLLVLASNPWHASGRLGILMNVVDRLMTDQVGELDPSLWALTAAAIGVIVETARGRDESVTLLERAEHLADSVGATYASTVARWLRTQRAEQNQTMLAMARERGDVFSEGLCVITAAHAAVGADPASAGSLLAQAAALANTSGSEYLRECLTWTRADAARDLGDVPHCIELALSLVPSRSAITVTSGALVLATAGLLARDQRALTTALDATRRLQRKMPGATEYVNDLERSFALLSGAAPPRDAPVTIGLSTACANWIVCRHILEAGQAREVLHTATAAAAPTALGSTMVAAVDAAVSGQEHHWHNVLRLAVAHGLPLFAVDALEHLGTSAAASESDGEALRLLAAAQRLRDETGYQWRFAGEQRLVDDAFEVARGMAGDDADSYVAEGQALEWRDAAAYAQRARGQRARPSHGWASLTPTERQVVALVTQGLTNPQIAARLFMARATVKTHLEHIFAKTGIHTRAELAAQAARGALR